MEIESITLYLAKKHLETIPIHAEISNVLGEGTVGHSSVTRFLRKRRFAPTEEPETKEPEPIDNVILHTFDEQPFAPLWQFARRILIPMTTVPHHLVNTMRYKLK
jgi:hypothetical protein